MLHVSDNNLLNNKIWQYNVKSILFHVKVGRYIENIYLKNVIIAH